MTTEEMKANIQNGITWLNENRPKWQDKVRQKIEVGEFDMMFPCNCVIGTIYGNFWNLYDFTNAYMDEKAIDHGFALPDSIDEDELGNEYDKLTQLWIEAVNDLRKLK